MFVVGAAGSDMLQTGEGRGRGEGVGRKQRQVFVYIANSICCPEKKKIGAPHFPNNMDNGKTEETTKIFNSFHSIVHHAQKRSTECGNLCGMFTTPAKVPLLLLSP